MKFRFDYVAFVILIAASFLFSLLKIIFSRNSGTPSWKFSDVKQFKTRSIKLGMIGIPRKLHLGALFFFMSAFADPHFLTDRIRSDSSKPSTSEVIPSEGIAIYLALDQSGSMGKKITITENGVKKSVSKMEMLKEITGRFISGHPNDLLGLIAFARIPRVLVPLTSDQKTLIEKLNEIQVVDRPEEDGTAIGYAILKTVRLISATRYFAEQMRKEKLPPYVIKSAAAVIVTDGFQDPNRLDAGNRLRTIELEEVSNYARDERIRLYIVNLDPEFASSDYAPHRRQLKKITEKTGGAFFMIEDPGKLEEIYDRIDRLEKGTIFRKGSIAKDKSIPESIRFSLYPYFIASGLFCLLAAVAIDAGFLRRVP